MSLSLPQLLPRPAPPVGPLFFPWRVVYALNFSTGEPILTHLDYLAKSSGAALRLFHQEINRARLVAPFRCSVHVVKIEPSGMVND